MTDKKEIEKLIAAELAEANEKYPLFHSPHEAFAVLLEECDELEDATTAIKHNIEDMWERVKADGGTNNIRESIRYWAIDAAREAIQVAAMCDKMKQSHIE